VSFHCGAWSSDTGAGVVTVSLVPSANHQSTITPDFHKHSLTCVLTLTRQHVITELGFHVGSFVSDPAFGWLQGEEVFLFNFVVVNVIYTKLCS
jgi:hypothetical protein